MSMRELIERKLEEGRKVSSSTVIRALRGVAEDEDADEAAFLNLLADRINQTYPGEDIDIRVINKVAKEPVFKKYWKKIGSADLRELISDSWDMISNGR